MNPEIDVRIDRLEIHGVQTFDADAFRAAFDSHLTALIGEHTLQPQVQWAGTIALHTSTGADSSDLGILVAQAVYGQMTRGVP